MSLLILYILATFTFTSLSVIVYCNRKYGWRAALKALPSAALVGLLCVLSAWNLPDVLHVILNISPRSFDNGDFISMTCFVAVFWLYVFASLPKFWEWLFKRKPRYEAVLSFVFLLVATMAFGYLFMYFYLKYKSPWL